MGMGTQDRQYATSFCTCSNCASLELLQAERWGFVAVEGVVVNGVLVLGDISSDPHLFKAA